MNIKFEDEKVAICFYIAKLNSKRVGYENFLRCWNNRFNEDLYGGKKRIKDDLRQHHKLLNPVQQDKFTELFERGTHLYGNKTKQEIEAYIKELRIINRKDVPQEVIDIARKRGYRIIQGCKFAKPQKRKIGKCDIELSGFRIEKICYIVNKFGKELTIYKPIRGKHFDFTADDVMKYFDYSFKDQKKGV